MDDNDSSDSVDSNDDAESKFSEKIKKKYEKDMKQKILDKFKRFNELEKISIDYKEEEKKIEILDLNIKEELDIIEKKLSFNFDQDKISKTIKRGKDEMMEQVRLHKLKHKEIELYGLSLLEESKILSKRSKSYNNKVRMLEQNKTKLMEMCNNIQTKQEEIEKQKKDFVKIYSKLKQEQKILERKYNEHDLNLMKLEGKIDINEEITKDKHYFDSQNENNLKSFEDLKIE